MNQIVLPVIIVDGLDVSLYESVADVELQLEPVDVANNEYRAYDAQGRLLTIRTDGQRNYIEASELSPQHSQELAHQLRDFLAAVQVPFSENDGLPQLVQRCIDAGFLYKVPRKPEG